MRNNFIYFLAIPFLLFLTNCQPAQQTTHTYLTRPVFFPEVTIELPELPLDHLATINVPEEEEFLGGVWVDITDSFSPVDQYEFTVRDPKLFAEDNKLVIDLSRIREEEYAFPLPGAKLISEYAGKRRNHTGVDLKVSRRDTIVSAFDGVVRMSRRNATYGNVIIVRHYNGLETLYSHNTQNLVKVGDRVKAGEPIAVSGQTGRASTDHLHFEVRVNGQHFNPALVFDFTTQELNNKSLLCVKNGSKITINQVDPFPYQTAYARGRKEESLLAN
ncbi:MAG: M23 family metallopeptidase [Tannerellaceae bacterium]|nr:M23 family metallopeptidase [Tannerellaceae bacterium]